MKYEDAIHRQDPDKPINPTITKVKVIYGFDGKVLPLKSPEKIVACYSEGTRHFVAVGVNNILVDPYKKHNKEEAAKLKKKKQNAETKLVEVEQICFDQYLHYLQTQTEAFYRLAQNKIKNHRGETGHIEPQKSNLDKLTAAQIKKMGIHRPVSK